MKPAKPRILTLKGTPSAKKSGPDSALVRLQEGSEAGSIGERRRSRFPIVLTIGHSTRSIEEFIALLQAHGANRVMDVRTVPRSRHNPQFNRDALPNSLKAVGIGYTHMASLGGLRHSNPDSINTGWRNVSFRGYADYMQTPEFEAALEELIQMAHIDRLALMCAEAVPWRCHRSLIADALIARGIQVEEIMSGSRCQIHSPTSFAKVQGTHVIYPSEHAKV